MINLMYIIFIALMGLGIHRESSSSEKPIHSFANERSVSPAQHKADSLIDTTLMASINSGHSLILKGDIYKAQIQLVYKPQTGKRRVHINGEELQSGSAVYQVKTQTVGRQQYAGYVSLLLPNGEQKSYPFRGEYEVIEPHVAIAPILTNILYAGIDNELNISVAGVPQEKLLVRADGGVIERKINSWLVRPTHKDGSCKLSVYMMDELGEMRLLGAEVLRVRPLPPPSPYLLISEGKRFRGGSVSRTALLEAGEVRAASDDSVLDLEYKVESFQTITFDMMGNAIPEVSRGNKFSDRQIRQIQNCPRGKRIYISEIKARAADGVLHSIPAIELIIQ